MSKIQKPIIKWVGGKTQLLDTILKKFPKKINNYHETFIGGASVLFGLLHLKSMNQIEIEGEIFAYDLNERLIHLYNYIKNEKQQLYLQIFKYFHDYDKKEPDDKETFYYKCRDDFNTLEKNDIKSSALFVFLNKTGFHGVYRENSKGKFNVPYGHYKKTPKFMSKEQFYKLSDLIQCVTFMCLSFKESLKKAVDGDFIYLDPPYAPENNTSFTKYNKAGFTIDDNKELFNTIKNMKNVKFLMSNANVELVQNSFQEYTKKEVTARRAIHRNNPGKTTTELLIQNY